MGLFELSYIANKHRGEPLRNIRRHASINGEWRFAPARWRERNDGERSHWTFSPEDKAKQRTVHDALVAIYDPDFFPFVYGFRPGFSNPCEQAVNRLRTALNQTRNPVLIKTDIERCFDSIAHDKLRAVLDRRVTDKAVRTVIDRFLRTEGRGKKREHGRGVLPGSVLGPVLTNIYLAAALDEWLTEHANIYERIRYADDIGVIPPDGVPPETLLENMRARLEEYALKLNENKTKIARAGESIKVLGIDLVIPDGVPATGRSPGSVKSWDTRAIARSKYPYSLL